MNLDPRAKLVLYGAGTVAALATTAPLRLAGLLAGALLVVVAVRGLRRWLGLLKLLGPMLIILGFLSAAGNGAREAVAPPLKLLLLGTLATALFATLTADELGDALTLLRLPPGVGFVLVGGLRYAPALAEGWADLLDALRARGATIPRGPRALPLYARLLGPAVARALRTADDMAEAMESRGFGAPGATPPDQGRLRARDWLAMALGVAALVGYIVWWR